MSKKIIPLLTLILIGTSVVAQKQVDTITVFSTAMQSVQKAVVITPINYKKSKSRYPVVYLLHGYSGNYSNWIKRMPAIPQLSSEYNCIIVCPDGGYSGWYVDSDLKTSNKYETFITSELVKYVDQRYRTLPGEKSRAITGLSMGGHGALMLAMRHQQVFGAAASMSGALDLKVLKYGLPELIGDTVTNMVNYKKYSVTEIVDTFSNKKMPLLIDCGVQDFLIEANRKLHAKLIALKIPHDYVEREGSHTWPYWTNALPYHLLFFRRYFDSK